MNDHDTLEARLAHALDLRATGLHDAPFTLDDVRGRARGIRRRRRGVVAGVVAAVVAVVVPAVLLAGGGRDRAIEPAPQPAVPGSAVLHDGEVTLPDGRRVAVDLPDDVTMFGVLADGRIVAPVNETQSVRVLAADGSRIADYPVLSTAITMGEDDRTVAWTGPDYRIRVLESGADEPVTFPGVPMAGEAEGSIDAVLGSDCVEGGCRVLAGDFTTTSYEITLDGAEPLTTPQPFRVEDVSPDRRFWAVRYADDSDPQYGCAGLYDVAVGDLVARTCETTGLRFAPDGRHLLAMEGDNNTYGEVSVLDLSLAPALRFEPADGVLVSRAAWADSGHLLVGTVRPDGTDWTLSRVAVAAGAEEVLNGPAPGGNPESVTEYLFSA